jgi:hypothetical protein
MLRALLNIVGANSIANATKSTDDQLETNTQGLILVLDVTALAGTGTPSLQVVLELKDDVSGKYISFGTFTAVTATGTYTYVIGLGVGAAADGITATKNYPPPSRWRARVVGGGSTITNATYTLASQRA